MCTARIYIQEGRKSERESNPEARGRRVDDRPSVEERSPDETFLRGVCCLAPIAGFWLWPSKESPWGKRVSLSLFFHNGSASWLTYEIAAAAAAAAVPNTMSPSSSFLQLYSYSGGAVMKSNENSLNALFSFSIIHMTDDFIDLFSPPPPSASVFLSFPTLRQRRRDTLACHRKSPIIADSIGPGLQSRVFLQKR